MKVGILLALLGVCVMFLLASGASMAQGQGHQGGKRGNRTRVGNHTKFNHTEFNHTKGAGHHKHKHHKGNFTKGEP